MLKSKMGFALGALAIAAFSSTACATPVKPIKIAQLSISKSKASISPDEADNIRVYKECNKAVVNVTSSVVSANMQNTYFNVFPHPDTGSGSIITPNGYILTNNHVVEKASSIQVTIYTGQTLPARVIGVDPSSDLAVIKIDPPSDVKLSVIRFGDSSELEVGRKVLAIGNPFGLERTLTQGIISSNGRTLRTENGRLIKGIIQTDAAINPGNSGGPLLDTDGNMVGINTAIMSKSGQSAGIGFAIPVNVAKRIVPELIAHHQIARPDLGILVIQPLDVGLRVVRLQPQGPAELAGLVGQKVSVRQQGPFTIQTIDSSQADIITSIDNTVVHSVDDLLSYVEGKKPGQTVVLTILRQGKSIKVPVKLSETGAGQV
jgi:S1-C subfamily serine protease